MTLLLQTAPGPSATGAIAALNVIIDRVLDYAILLAAVGAVAMALIEVVKKLFDFRAKFHAERWTEFMIWNGYVKPAVQNSDAYVQLLQLASGVSPAEATDAVKELTGNTRRPRVDLKTAQREEPAADTWKRSMVPTFWRQPKPAYSVFAQSTAHMTSTLGDAVDVALASPHAYEEMFDFFVRGARQGDIDRWKRFTSEEALPANATDEEKKRRAVDQKEAAGALSRLRQVSKRRLASFQLFTEQSWASWNQLWSNAVGAVVMGGVLYTVPGLNPILKLAGALFGGLLAPVAKDLVDALQRAKSDIKEAT